MVLDWETLIPPAVPDDQNIFKAAKMQEWFVGRGSTELSKRLANNKDTDSVSAATNTIVTQAAALDYLKWSDSIENDFNLIREA